MKFRTFFFLSILILGFGGTQEVSAASLNYISPNAYDIASATYAGSGEEFNVSSWDVVPQGIIFSEDGIEMYIVGSTGDTIDQFTLSTAYDISTASFTASLSVSGQDGDPSGIVLNNDGTKIFLAGDANNAVFEYTLSTPYLISTATYAGIGETFGVGTQESNIKDILFNNDGTKMFIIGLYQALVGSHKAISEYSLSVAYDISTANYTGAFSVSGQDSRHNGFTFNNDGTKIFTTGDDNNRVFEYTLSTAYTISSASYSGTSFSIGGQESYPNGITFNNDGSKMFIIGRNDDSIVEYSIPIGSSSYAEVSANNGSLTNTIPIVISLAGDTFQDTDADNILDVESEVTLGNVPAGLTPVMTLSGNDSTVTLTFTGNATGHQGANDVSDITFVFDNTAFTGNDASVVARSGSSGAYSSNVGISFIDQPYLTHHASTFEESDTDDGSVPTMLNFTLNGETFSGTGVLTGGSHYIANNVPVGLTAVITVLTDTTGTFELTGNADSHLTSDSVSDMELVWADASFDSINAEHVTDSTKSNFFVNFIALASRGNGPVFRGPASALPGYVKPRMQTIYPDGTIVYHDEIVGDSPLATVPAVNTLNNSTPELFIHILTRGVQSDEVKRLQQFLNTNPDTQLTSKGHGSLGEETTFFGSLTENAVRKFQTKHSIISYGSSNTTGFGRVGPRTQNMINLLALQPKKASHQFLHL